jgi:hypothetical protein
LVTSSRRGSTRCARRHTKASRAHDPLIPLTCVRQAGEAAFYNLAISTIGELEAAKDPTDIDAFTKAFMPAFKKFAVLPHRKRELEAVMQKIQDAGEIVTEKESAVKADKEKEKNRKKLSGIKSGKRETDVVEASDVARGSKRSKSAVGKAITSMMM